MMRYLPSLLFLSPLGVTAIQIFSAPGDIPATVPIKCRAALAQNIACEPFLVTGQKAANGDHLAGPLATTYCTAACSSSLQTFHSNVVASCGSTSYILNANTTSKQSPQGIASGLAWAYSLVCLQDGDGFCLSDLYADKESECSDCALKYGAVMLSSDYGRIRYSEPMFSSILSSCSAPVSKYPWTYTPTSISTPPTATTTSLGRPTCTGAKYTVKQGDSCESISKANSVGTDRMIDLNKLDYSCNTLKPGSSLCIQDQCTTTLVEKGQTCESLTKGKSYSIIHLQAWNPSLQSMCNVNVVPNLDDLAGKSLCISPPGGGDAPSIEYTWTSHTRPTLSAPIFSEWITTTASTLPPEGTWDGFPTPTNYTIPVVTGSADPAQQSHDAAAQQYCWITEEDVYHGYDENEEPGACQALYSTYCEPEPTIPLPTAPPRIPVVCTPDRSHYNDTRPTPVPTPNPHQPHMTKGCYKFYKVRVNDGCAAVASANNVTLSDFYAWNPDVGTECRALQVGTYVCVAYDARLAPKTSTLNAVGTLQTGDVGAVAADALFPMTSPVQSAEGPSRRNLDPVTVTKHESDSVSSGVGILRATPAIQVVSGIV